ncbi:hypothetical protein C8A00DRAFT_18489, partial [Chaetomidium leptoderma]
MLFKHLLTLSLQQFSPDLDRLGPLYQTTHSQNRSMPGPADIPYPPNGFPTTDQSAFPATAAAYPWLQPGATPVDAVAVNWQPTNNSLYGGNSSSPGPSASVFGYASQQNTPNPYASEYVSPTALHIVPQQGFKVYPWPGPEVYLSVSLGTETLSSPTLQQQYQIPVGSPEGTAVVALSDSDPALYGEVEPWHHHQPRQPNQGRRHKRAKKSPNLASKTGPSTGTSNNNSSSKVKLRSSSASSRASKNTPQQQQQQQQQQ